jgi:hypothetical protein
MLGTALIVSNIATIANTAVTIAKTIAMIALLGPLAIAAIAFVALTSPITAVVVGVGLLIAGFKYLYDTGWTFGTVLEAIGDRFKRFFIFLQEGFLAVLDKITFGDANEAVKVSQAALVEEKKALDDKEKLRDAIREQNAAEIEANKKGKGTDDAARNAQKAGLEEDKKSFAERKISSTALTGLAAREAKAKEDAVKAEEKKSSVDYNAGAEDQLKQFAGQQGSALVPKDQQASTKADSAKGTPVSKDQQASASADSAKGTPFAAAGAELAGTVNSLAAAGAMLAGTVNNLAAVSSKLAGTITNSLAASQQASAKADSAKGTPVSKDQQASASADSAKGTPFAAAGAMLAGTVNSLAAAGAMLAGTITNSLAASQQASAKADSAKGTLVSDAESKKATDAAAKKAAEEKLKEYEMVKEAAKPTGAARTQESAETLLAQLNTNMTRLIQITQEQKSISEDQLRGIKGMSGNLFA